MGAVTTVPDIRFVFFGNSLFSCRVLVALMKCGYKPVVAISKRGSYLAAWCHRHNVTYLTPDHLEDTGFIKKLRNYNAEVFVVAGFEKLPPVVYTMPERHTLNVHPSLLPKYRGSEPIQTQIISNDQETGVTIHVVDEKYDHGPIVAQAAVHKEPWPPTPNDLGLQIARVGGQLLAELLPDWVAGTINTKPQDHTKTTYTKAIIDNTPFLRTLDVPAYDLYLLYKAAEALSGTYLQLSQRKDPKLKISVRQAYFRNNCFIIKSVFVNSEDEPIEFDVFLDQYNLADDQDWNQFSATHNQNLESGVDRDNASLYVELKEIFFQCHIPTALDEWIKDQTSAIDFTPLLSQPAHCELVAKIFWHQYQHHHPFQIGVTPVVQPLIEPLLKQEPRNGQCTNVFILKELVSDSGYEYTVDSNLTEDLVILIDSYTAAQTRLSQLLHPVASVSASREVFSLIQLCPSKVYMDTLTQNVQLSFIFSPREFGL